ncbi:hypothetical protein, partial [Escherichia coli]|uniref:hypothetical protein n=1 Tax=Escherichia coli TaxID=562 RepID=UPI001BC83A46
WSTSKTPSYTKSVSWQHHQCGLLKIRLFSTQIHSCGLCKYEKIVCFEMCDIIKKSPHHKNNIYIHLLFPLLLSNHITI